MSQDGEARSSLLTIDKTQKRIDCAENNTVSIAVSVKVDEITMVAIHPQNETYPIATMNVYKLLLEFAMH